MAIPRVIPVLLLQNGGLVKTTKFKEAVYVGDPINAVKIFNEKNVDELCFLDIDASKKNTEPNYTLIKEIASECFMPLSYAGAVKNVDQIKKLIQSGVEKIIINTQLRKNPDFVKEACNQFGSSTIVGAIDVKKNFWGKHFIYDHASEKLTNLEVLEFVKKAEELGIGELLVNNVDLDGTMQGYDFELIKKITTSVNIPVVACGGCGSIQDIDKVVNDAKAQAAAAGSFFVFHGKHNAVLITYPDYSSLEKIFDSKNEDI